jgi:hypothetical protein
MSTYMGGNIQLTTTQFRRRSFEWYTKVASISNISATGIKYYIVCSLQPVHFINSLLEFIQNDLDSRMVHYCLAAS